VAVIQNSSLRPFSENAFWATPLAGLSSRLLFSIVTLLILITSPLLAEAEEQQPDITCPLGHPLQPFFQGIKHVYIYVDVPPTYREAIECHGHEQECVLNAPGLNSSHFDRDRYIKDLRARFDAYPEALSPNTLTSLISDRAIFAYSSILPHDAKCQVVAPISLSRQSTAKADIPSDTLTITVRVEIVEKPGTRIAALAISLFRPDCGHSTYSESEPFITAIPLDSSNDEIAAALKDLIRFIHTPDLKEWVQH
jgi:hypothetical protein